MKNISQMRGLAERVAIEAGRRLSEAGHAYRAISEQSAHDVKLHADTESEAYIREALGAGSNYPVIGEEEGGSASLLDGRDCCWVVDPLDGTANYERRIPLCCVSIGLFRGRTPVLGVVYGLYRGELYSGQVGVDCRLNGEVLRPEWAASREQAMLYAGFPSGRDFSSDALEGFLRKVQVYRKVRSLGSAAIGLAWVAAGRLDAYYEEGVRLWDVAAGLALVQSAGGTFRIHPSDTGEFLAFNISAGGREELLAE